MTRIYGGYAKTTLRKTLNIDYGSALAPSAVGLVCLTQRVNGLGVYRYAAESNVARFTHETAGGVERCLFLRRLSTVTCNCMEILLVAFLAWFGTNAITYEKHRDSEEDVF